MYNYMQIFFLVCVCVCRNAVRMTNVPIWDQAKSDLTGGLWSATDPMAQLSEHTETHHLPVKCGHHIVGDCDTADICWQSGVQTRGCHRMTGCGKPFSTKALTTGGSSHWCFQPSEKYHATNGGKFTEMLEATHQT